MPEVVVATPTHLSLADSVIVDYRETVSWARTLLAGPTALLRPAWTLVEIGALGGEVLPDWYDERALRAREQFRQLCLHALESLCDQLAKAGRYCEALVAGLSAVAIEPLRESAHRRVIAVHLLECNYIEALRQFRNATSAAASASSACVSAASKLADQAGFTSRVEPLNCNADSGTNNWPPCVLVKLRREREERARGASLAEALRVAAATSGRAIVVSGLTVMVALADRRRANHVYWSRDHRNAPIPILVRRVHGAGAGVTWVSPLRHRLRAVLFREKIWLGVLTWAASAGPANRHPGDQPLVASWKTSAKRFQ